MKNITEVNNNSCFSSSPKKDECLVYPDVLQEPFEICGFPWFETDKQFVRIPDQKALLFNDNIKQLALHTSGGLMRFKTNSRRLLFEAELASVADMSRMPRSGSSGFDFYAGKGKQEKFVKVAVPESGSTYCKCEIEAMDGTDINWRINFPLYSGVRNIMIGIDHDAKLEKPDAFSIQSPVVFYGSSITQGCCASRPGNAYTHIICRWLDSNMINFGFSGNAKGEPEMAKLISTIGMSLFVMDYDHNAPEPEHLLKTHEPFFRIIREAQPDLPIILISRPCFDYNLPENTERRRIIMSTFEEAQKRGDKNVYFIDGKKLFGRTDRDACTVDACHPNDLGFMRMAKVIFPVIRKLNTKSENVRQK